MKKVLIALDYDPTAQKVAEEGFSLAKKLEAEVILLHVVSDPLHYSSIKQFTVMGFAGYNDSPALITKDVEVLKKESKIFLNKSKHHLGDPAIKTVVKVGNLAETILKTAKGVHADIIIIGSHRRKSMEKTLLGTVAEKVLYSTSIPVFIIPTRKKR
jgi:nucleotide-binding universal stress UspA family protein